MDQETVQGLPEMWAVVGLFGHQKVAGKLTTQALGAACLLRIDTPAHTKKRSNYDRATGKRISEEVQVSAVTRFVGVSAIYDINPCSEQMVMAMLENYQIDPSPVSEYELNRFLKLPAVVDVFENNLEEDDGWEDGAEEKVDGSEK